METNEEVETFTFNLSDLGVLDDLPTDHLYQLVEQMTEQVANIKGEEREDFIQREARYRAAVYALILMLDRYDRGTEDDY